MPDIPLHRLELALADARHEVLTRVRDVRSKLDSIEYMINNGRAINTLGELQQLGPQLDAACAKFGILQSLKLT